MGTQGREDWPTREQRADAGEGRHSRPDHSKWDLGQAMQDRRKLEKEKKNCWLFLEIFSSVKISVFTRLWPPGSRCVSDAITSRKLEQRGNYFGTA